MIYAFAEYELDTIRYEFRRAGNVHALEPQVFNVLAYLIRHRHRVVTKDELFEHLWPQQIVSDASLYQRLKSARQAIGDSGNAQRAIQTVHGRGYRFIAAVEEYEVQAIESREPVSAVPLASLPPSAPSSSDDGDAQNPRESSPNALVGEHKLVTVVCGTLANTTALADMLGPDGLRHLLQWLWRFIQDEMQRYDGVFQTVGDHGFLAIFGIPVAYEDHARRAVLTALDLQQRLHQAYTVPGTQQRLELAMCLGVHTGRAMVDWNPRESPWPSLITGNALDMARHVQYRAAPGTLLASDATLQFVHGDVEYLSCDPLQIPGQHELMQIYRIRNRQARYAPAVLHDGRRLTEFVGRERDMATLHALLAQAKAGQGQVVGIMGEPGMGKSRLLYEFSQSLPSHQARYLEGPCASHSSTTPYTPVRHLLRQACGIAASDDTDAIVSRVHQSLQGLGLQSDTTAPYLLHLLGVVPHHEALAGLTPQTIKTRTFNALRQLVLYSSQQYALVLAIENLQWADATSEAWLASLVDQLANAPVLLLTTHRPGYRPPWLDKSYATQLSLTGLTIEEGQHLVRDVLGTTQVPDDLIDQILSKAAGNPFFLEEIAHNIRNAGELHSTLGVPDTVQAVLAARVDRLPATLKGCLQAAAMIGKDVPWALLQAITELPDAKLELYLQHLQTAEFLYEIRGQAERLYTFKHALTQEVVYQSLVRQTQRHMHRRIAQILVERFPRTVETQPEWLAQHYTAAGQYGEAVDFWYQAGSQARERAAYREAVSHLQQGLEVLPMLPDTDRTTQELRLQRTLAASWVPLKGLCRFRRWPCLCAGSRTLQTCRRPDTALARALRTAGFLSGTGRVADGKGTGR
jgi:DNA-binding winged helix-turn-helix (wHTH) protein